jgi:methyl-accepting chemotaxis protein
MIGKNIKIATKLNISAAAFFLPLVVLFFLIISVSLAIIRTDENELRGIDCLRPAVELMRLVPAYAGIASGSGAGNVLPYGAPDLFEELKTRYGEYFGKSLTSAGYNLTLALSKDWDSILEGSEENRAAVCERFMSRLRDTIVYVGNASGLVTDSEIEGNHLAGLAVQELPRMQERLVFAGRLVNAWEDDELTEEKRSEFRRHGTLLVYADHARIRSGFDAIKETGAQDEETARQFENLSKAYYADLYRLTGVLETITGSSRSVQKKEQAAAFREAAAQTADAVYRLQSAALDRIEALVKVRIQDYENKLLRSLIAASVAAIAAFVIIVITVSSIRKSALAVQQIFKRLRKNDLLADVRVFSGDELGELMAALGNFLQKLRADFVSFNQSVSMVSTAVYDLSASAKEITTTANEQSASVAEIVSTMESSKNLSEQVAAKTVEVADLAVRTQELSLHGAELRDANQDMMRGIRDQNTKIIEEIKNLADMLSRIDESVQIIDTIADQTKLIAFNAALEASSSGETGSRFTVVAGEIRRFADNVVESVVEIKEKISELQTASQALISEADNGARQIDSGYDRMVEQKEVFENIVDISQTVATRSQQISNLSKQQELASAQIFTALKEISAGVRQFVTATASTSATADSLNTMSIELKETLAKYKASN